MANPPIPPSFCTLFFSWHKLLPKVVYAHLAGRSAFALVRISVVFSGAFARLRAFRTASDIERCGGTERDRPVRAASRVFQRLDGSRGAERTFVPGADAAHASDGGDLSAGSQIRQQRERLPL